MSSAESSPSPRPLPAPVARGLADEENLPSGQCRYILLNPEIKGLRCACVGFTLNRGLPGVSCQCGHLSCYHIKSTEPPLDKSEVDGLRRRIQVLEGQLDRENHTGIGSALGDVVKRLGELEEQVEGNKEDASQEMRDCYRNLNLVWQSVGQLKERQALYESTSVLYDERLDDHDDTLQRLGDRLIDFDEASMALEERVEALEYHDVRETQYSQHRPSSTAKSEQSKNTRWPVTQRDWPSSSRETELPRAGHAPLPSSHAAAFEGSESKQAEPWTVHVSLLPTASQPFPFEVSVLKVPSSLLHTVNKLRLDCVLPLNMSLPGPLGPSKDTNAYKRCLSRGLHQMLAVGGSDSESFATAVAKAFGSLLRGRAWVPLQARLCDAVTLQGLPMLRPLEASLVGSNYDLEFLQRHCAVCCPNGKVESLYIALLSDSFSWHFLRRSPCYLEGLEASWEYDSLLDPSENLEDGGDEEDRPSAGDIMPPLPSLKRTASEMSRAPSFSSPSAVDGAECSRPKLQRTCIQAPLELRRHGVETV
ncbi:Uu.00g091720.m01.CDS01 [Anthostomella pinea]|uniref:Uu.00g091720.m01.CDS01 n=1 Tax=Anthostomella pinea TaxID=933095 RepID=A0AAI8VN43_9PEZI|nr:Uu.00g091720.m01.CDS01 [Anthostomella pinea]